MSSMIGLPRWTESIRFRLSLTYALAVFAGGSILIGGLYIWQVRQLNEPLLTQRSTVVVDTETGQPLGVQILTNTPERDQALRNFERSAYLLTLDKLRRGSLFALGVLFFVAFGTGWLLAGWALRPVNRMAMVARDITATDLSRRIGLPGPEDEMKHLADTFDAMLDRLQAAFEDQRRFVQDASHELRNPLAAARSSLELVLEDPAANAAELRNSAEVAHRSTERMAGLVDDLLIQARVGVPEVIRSDVNLGELAAEIAEELQATAQLRDLELVAESPEAAVTVRGDGPALRRAVSNLVSNALRLAPADSTVRIDVTRHGGWANIAVQDSGPGLSADDRTCVFDRFWRGEQQGNGTGLGLSIVKQVTERHGGSVRVDSVLDVGSTFTMELPISARSRVSRPTGGAVDNGTTASATTV